MSELLAQRRPGLAPVLQGAVALAATVLVAAVLLALGGHSPGEALQALARGAFGTWTRFTSATLVRATPLLLTGLAVALAFRAGVWNIGAEGQLYAGATAGVAVALLLPGAPALVLLPLTLGMGAMAGMAWAWIPAHLRRRAGVGEVITTLLMNFVALFTVQFLLQGPLQEPRGVFNQSDRIPAPAELPTLPGSRLHLGFFLALVLALVLWHYLARTPGGFRIRATGASPEASRVSGRFDPHRTAYRAFLASGALAGLAGWVQVSGVTYRMYEDLSPGWGYTAIAVALLARLHPVAVVFTAVLFGALEVGGGAMQREAAVPEVWVRGMEALVILSVLAVDRAVRSGAIRGTTQKSEGA
ncbi:MAG: ABC transporter permease [Gemmatimonadetes bacterium]|nr:ABC transporter permease [Gemmatimonadota bacterium]